MKTNRYVFRDIKKGCEEVKQKDAPQNSLKIDSIHGCSTSAFLFILIKMFRLHNIETVL